MAKFNILRDALRKYRVGLLNLEEVIIIFRRVEEKMTKYTDNFELFRSKLRKYERNRLIEYQNKVFEVNKAIEEKAFEHVIALISEGKNLRQEIEEGLRAIEAFDIAYDLLKTLKLELNAKWLKKMPSILVLDRVLEDADKLMLEGKYLQAEVLIKFCSIQTQITKENTNKEEKSEIKITLSEKIEDLKIICLQTKAYSKFYPTEVFQIEGRIEVMLHRFLEEGQFLLVKKLVQDLNFVLKNRTSFRNRLLAFPEIEKLAEKEIQNAIQNDGWIGGANCILILNLKQFSDKIRLTEEKLDMVQSGYKNNI